MFLAGRVQDTNGRPLPGLHVEVRSSTLWTDRIVATAKTDPDGGFRLYHPREKNAWFHVRDARGVRALWSARLDGQARLEPQIAPDALSGWLATGAASPVPMRATAGNSFEPLVDGEEAFRRVLADVERATSSVLLMQLYSSTTFVPERSRGRSVTLDEALLSAAQRGVRVRILLNGNRVAPDDVRATRAWFDERAPHDGRILVRKYPVNFGVAHAKMLIRDDENAILIDPPFEERWWDTSAHDLRSSQRGAAAPEHSVSCALRGPIVADLRELFRILWDERAAASADGERALGLATRPGPGEVADGVGAQLTVTTPGGALRAGGAHTILESYQRAISQAQGSIYLENQYFTNPTLRQALRRALDADRDLRVIMVLNEKPDALTYPAWQEFQLRKLGWPREPRLGVFSLWCVEQAAEARDGARSARPIYVHSKVGIVDDVWATTGSANLDSVSLDTERPWRDLDRRSVEANVTLFDGIAGFPPRGVVRAFRERLWREHLGASIGGTPDAWLAAWRDRASADLDALAHGGEMKGFVLPWATKLPKSVQRWPEPPAWRAWLAWATAR